MFIPTEAPSHKAQALAQAMAEFVRAKHAQDPTLQHHEVQQAFALAKYQTAKEFGANPKRGQVLAAALAALAVMVAGFIAFYSVQP